MNSVSIRRYAVYAWWLCLRLVFNTYLNRIDAGGEQNAPESAVPEEGPQSDARSEGNAENGN